MKNSNMSRKPERADPEVGDPASDAVWSAIEALRRDVDALLQRDRFPAPPEQIERLLAALFAVFPTNAFTAVGALEGCLDDDPDARTLQDVMLRCLGGRPTVAKCSRLLARSCGTIGPYSLGLIDPHSRDGKLFRVTK